MTFDPYRDWLGIKPDERPPNYYRLVGVALFEPDAERIHQSSLRRIAGLRKHQTGPHAETTQRLMNEISQARLCLMDPDRRAEYDLRLHLELDARGAPSPGRSSAPRGLAAAGVLLLLAAVVATVLILRGLDHGKEGAATDLVDANEDRSVTKVGPSTAVVEKRNSSTAKDAATTSLPSSTKSTAAVRTVQTPIPMAPRDGFVLVRRAQGRPTAREPEEREPINLEFLNSAADDDLPALDDPEGRTLYFVRKERGVAQLLVGRRSGADESFVEEGRWLGLTDRGVTNGLSWGADGLHGLLAACERGRCTLFEIERSKRGMECKMKGALAGLASPASQYAPCLSADGRELYFTQEDADGPTLYVAKREKTTLPFAAPANAGLPAKFERASLTADGAVLYMQGPTAESDAAIYRSRRKPGGPWEAPELVESLRAWAGARPAKNQSPCVAGDGKRLFFASNRDGGRGGMDLWLAKLEPMATVVPRPAESTEDAKKKPTKAAPKAKPPSREVVPIDGPIAHWLILGPLPASEGDALKDLTTLKELAPTSALQRFAVVGEVDKRSGLKWRRGDGPSERGVHFLFLPLRLSKTTVIRVRVEKAPGGGVLWVDKKSNELAVQETSLWTKADSLAATTESISLIAGRHRLLFALCVADPSAPLVVRLIDGETDQPLEGAAAAF